MRDPTLPWYLQDVGATARSFGDGPWIAFDFETTNLDKGWAGNPHNRLVLASWEVHDGRTGHCFGDEFHQPNLCILLSIARRERWVLVAHNAKFEAGWVRRMGFDPADFLWWDTQTGEYVLAGNRRWKLSLDHTARRYGRPKKDPVVQRQLDAGVCPSVINERALLRRNLKDTEDTAHIFREQRARMRPALKRVLFTRCLSVPVIEYIERQGVAVHPERTAAAVARAEQKLRDLEAEYSAFEAKYLDRAQWPDWMRDKKFTWTTDQVAWVLYRQLGVPEIEKKVKGQWVTVRNKSTKRWPHGRPVVSDKVLPKLKLETPEQREFLRLRKEYAKAKFQLAKTLRFFQGVLSDYGGVFHGQFNQTVTQTHRLSSSGRKLLMPDGKWRGIQFQNFPREFKDLFTAKRPGRLRAAHDAAQLEFRGAVELGNDEAGRRNIANGVDQHRLTASILFNKAPEDVTDEERQAAKPDTFKPLYGGRKGTPEQEAYYAAFRTWFPGIAATQEGWTHEVLTTGELRLPWGMTFYWPGTQMSRDGYIDNTPSIYNYPIQSLCTAEIVPIAIVYLFHRMRAHWRYDEAQLVNMVHDSAEAEIPNTPEAKETWLRLGRQCFGADVYEYLYRVYGMQWSTPLGLGTKFEGEKEISTKMLDLPEYV